MSLLRETDLSRLTLSRLLGIHVLFPDVLESELKALLVAAVRERREILLARLVFLSLVDPTRYGLQLAARVHTLVNPDRQYVQLLRDIGNCPFWFGDRPGRALEAFQSLLWLLRRSTDWGTGIEELRAFLLTTPADVQQIKMALRKFEKSAIDSVLYNVAALRAFDHGSGLWSAVQAEGGDPESPVLAIQGFNERMHKVIANHGLSSTNTLLEHLENVDLQGRLLAASLEKVFTNVRDVVTQAENRWSALKNRDVQILFKVADDHPGVLFSRNHLSGVVNAVLENVEKYVTSIQVEQQNQSNSLWVKFYFHGYSADRDSSILEIYDNIPFQNPLEPRGGLKQVQQHCTLFGAHFECHPNLPETEKPRIRIGFRVDSSRRLYD